MEVELDLGNRKTGAFSGQEKQAPCAEPLNTEHSKHLLNALSNRNLFRDLI